MARIMCWIFSSPQRTISAERGSLWRPPPWGLPVRDDDKLDESVGNATFYRFIKRDWARLLMANRSAIKNLDTKFLMGYPLSIDTLIISRLFIF